MVERARHVAHFALAGLLAFGTDAAVLTVLTRGAGLDPYTARLIAIAVAMVVGYFGHRRWTFQSRSPPSLGEFARFIGVALSASVLNYAIYAGTLLTWPDIDPVAALVLATIVAMGASYAGYRFGVFRRPR